MANKLDLKYISELVVHAQRVDANAFAELFAATSDMQYAFALQYLRDSTLALEALEETYVYVLKNLRKLADPGLFIPWLNQVNMKMCFRKQVQQAMLAAHDEGRSITANEIDPENQAVQIKGERYLVRQIMTLPFTESQVLLLRYLCKMKPSAISDLLIISRADIRRCCERGYRHLRVTPSWKEGVSA